MDAKGSILVFLLFSLILFSSLTYCVLNKQSQLTSELDDQQNQLHGLQSQLHELHNQLFQVVLNDKIQFQESEHSTKVKGQLKRNERQAEAESDTLSATQILTNALTEIIEMKLTSYMDCNKNEYNYTKCTLKPGPKVILDLLGCKEELDKEDHVDQKVTLDFWDHSSLVPRPYRRNGLATSASSIQTVYGCYVMVIALFHSGMFTCQIWHILETIFYQYWHILACQFWN